MSSKRQKMTSKRGQTSEELALNYDHTKFVNEGVAEKFGLISKNRSFIKEKGFHHPEDFFRKIIAKKEWRAICQPPKPATTMIVQEFNANLATNMNKWVRVRGIWVNFDAKSFNKFYNLEPMDNKAFDSLYPAPNYPEVIRALTNGQGEWKINSEGHAVHFKAKHLAYIPKVWHHFITSRLIPKMNVCEVTAKHALLNYTII